MIQSVFTAEPKHHGTERRGIHVVSTKLCPSENVLDLEIPETPVVVFLCPKVIIYLPQSLRF